MLTIPTSLRVFAHRFATDMRKSFHGLVGIIESELGQQVESGHLFLFFNRRRDRVKILFFTGDGLMILYRLLERGTFETPRGWRDQSPQGTRIVVVETAVYRPPRYRDLASRRMHLNTAL